MEPAKILAACVAMAGHGLSFRKAVEAAYDAFGERIPLSTLHRYWHRHARLARELASRLAGPGDVPAVGSTGLPGCKAHFAYDVDGDRLVAVVVTAHRVRRQGAQGPARRAARGPGRAAGRRRLLRLEPVLEGGQEGLPAGREAQEAERQEAKQGQEAGGAVHVVPPPVQAQGGGRARGGAAEALPWQAAAGA